MNGQEIHKKMLCGAHRYVSLNIFATTLGDPERHQQNEVEGGQVCMSFLTSISFCCSWGQSAEFRAECVIVLTQWDISYILKYIFSSFPACPLVVKDGNNFAGTVFLCSFLFMIYGSTFITLFSQYQANFPSC